MSTLPTACPPRPERPVNRCCTTRLQVVPQASSPHRAASAIRRSPGWSTPKSRRSTPLDPPSSATVTMAVSWRVTRRSADREANSPWPPPSATTRGFSGRTGGTTSDGSPRAAASAPWFAAFLAVTHAPGHGGSPGCRGRSPAAVRRSARRRSEEHTSELQSRGHLVCRLLLEKKKTNQTRYLLYKKKKQKQK